jgi:hypothetical protein
VTNSNNNGGTIKVWRDIIYYDFPSQLPSPTVLHDYHPLWEQITFPNDLKCANNGSNDVCPCVSLHAEHPGCSITSNDPNNVLLYVKCLVVTSHMTKALYRYTTIFLLLTF